MNKWLELSKERREQILNQVSILSGILPHAIEKDWWVTLTLKAIFSTAWQENLVFKGGTSLTKSWKLIERFSEDIDLIKACLALKAMPINQKSKSSAGQQAALSPMNSKTGYKNLC